MVQPTAIGMPQRKALGLISPNGANTARMAYTKTQVLGLDFNAAAAAAAAAASSTAAMLSMNNVVREEFALEDGGTLTLFEEIGRGGFGTVRRGCLHGKAVAAKVIKIEEATDAGEASAQEDVARELRAHRQLFDSSSPPRHLLLELLHHLERPDSSILVLPLIDGSHELFDHVLERPNGHLTELEAHAIARLLAHALAFCHAQGVAHLDIKPQNVLVAEAGSGSGSPAVRLIDYGCADLFDPDRVDEAWVEECGGTANYMAPERHFEDDDRGFLAPPADVFGLYVGASSNIDRIEACLSWRASPGLLSSSISPRVSSPRVSWPRASSHERTVQSWECAGVASSSLCSVAALLSIGKQRTPLRPRPSWCTRCELARCHLMPRMRTGCRSPHQVSWPSSSSVR